MRLEVVVKYVLHSGVSPDNTLTLGARGKLPLLPTPPLAALPLTLIYFLEFCCRDNPLFWFAADCKVC